MSNQDDPSLAFALLAKVCFDITQEDVDRIGDWALESPVSDYFVFGRVWQAVHQFVQRPKYKGGAVIPKEFDGKDERCQMSCD